MFQSSKFTSCNQSYLANFKNYSLAMLCNVANLRVHPFKLVNLQLTGLYLRGRMAVSLKAVSLLRPLDEQITFHWAGRRIWGP